LAWTAPTCWRTRLAPISLCSMRYGISGGDQTHPDHAERAGGGLEPDSAMRREIVKLRQDGPWFAAAAAAFERVAAGAETDDDWQAMAPFFYGRWDAAAQAYEAAGEKQTNEDAADAFAAEGAFDPAATRAALAAFGSPVLVLAGGLDLQRPLRITAEFAALFPASRLVCPARRRPLPLA